ncbi:hypothetical protein K469DRAFT_689198 [Zopfia rhizophila CBS 207.26]|uniref:Glyoxalase/fosfomycin resistance/dioxygenase domain-containing protein n=1 Tax=Zopfia rhizophila CBS 207.26 TaxID=1314779 RepID=A0A6A6EW87_9PEZI|nr:hypothetical protein K469DRAFT_689198 [Zopfia rhizophila CBS 207.26]
MATTTIPSLSALDEKPQAIAPASLAHVVLQTNHFLTYDIEHHCIAITAVPNIQPRVPGTSGLQHIAFTFSTLPDLLTAYLQRKKHGMEPVWCVNHGPTTSIYYKDPDGNMLQTQIDNFDTTEEATDFMSERFRGNSLGVEFEPDEHIEKLKGGVEERELKRRSEGVKRGLADMKSLGRVDVGGCMRAVDSRE